MRIAIIGSRSITESFYPELCEMVPVGASEIVSGGAMGADTLAARYALEHGLPLVLFKPDYDFYGKAAPAKRNQDMVEYADYVLALWDGQSRGTAHAINMCLKTYTPVRVIPCRTPA